MIELQKYSKVDSDPFKYTLTRHTDKRDKLITYGAGALIVGFVLVSLQICSTIVDPKEFNLRLFESDSSHEAMKAYIDFLARFGKTQSDRQSTADRYKIFKGNYAKIMDHNRNADMLPFVMEVNYFADLSVEEFLDHHKLRVPKHLLASAKGHDHIHSRGHSNHSSRFDKINESLPKVKNWFTEGVVTAPYDQH